jgi:hypothetical protein
MKLQGEVEDGGQVTCFYFILIFLFLKLNKACSSSLIYSALTFN